MAVLPDDLARAAENFNNWQTSIVFLLTGIGGTMGFVGRSVQRWAKNTAEKHDVHFRDIDTRLMTLESHRHATDLRIVALEALSREVDSIGRRVDAGFEKLNDRLDKLADRRE